ncbi:MAG: hypothetical protein MHM6MM_004957 [Cercozoa sp. M6MM]
MADPSVYPVSAPVLAEVPCEETELNEIESTLEERKGTELPQERREWLEQNARRAWDKFYLRNGTRFYKDRHYLCAEFPVLQQLLEESDRLRIAAIGCGVGNSILPLLRQSPTVDAVAVDLSPRAVMQVRQAACEIEDNKTYDYGENDSATLLFNANKKRRKRQGARPDNETVHNESEDTVSPTEGGSDRKHLRLRAWQCDVASHDLPLPVVEFQSHCALLLFVLSAVAPDKQIDVLRRVKSALRPGGVVLFRDYARCDMAQLRFRPETSRLAENYYVRNDDTRSYFFQADELRSLFERAGFECEQCVYYRKEIRNRREQKTMRRVWLQGVFRVLSATESA